MKNNKRFLSSLVLTSMLIVPMASFNYQFTSYSRQYYYGDDVLAPVYHGEIGAEFIVETNNGDYVIFYRLANQVVYEVYDGDTNASIGSPTNIGVTNGNSEFLVYELSDGRILLYQQQINNINHHFTFFEYDETNQQLNQIHYENVLISSTNVSSSEFNVAKDNGDVLYLTGYDNTIIFDMNNLSNYEIVNTSSWDDENRFENLVINDDGSATIIGKAEAEGSYAFRIDSEGNVVDYEDTSSFISNSLVTVDGLYQLDNGNYVMGLGDNSGPGGKLSLVYFDENLEYVKTVNTNVLWEGTLGDNELIQLEDGNIAYISGLNISYQSSIAIFDQSGTLLYQKELNDGGSNEILDVSLNSSGDLLWIGSSHYGIFDGHSINNLTLQSTQLIDYDSNTQEATYQFLLAESNSNISVQYSLDQLTWYDATVNEISSNIFNVVIDASIASAGDNQIYWKIENVDQIVTTEFNYDEINNDPIVSQGELVESTYYSIDEDSQEITYLLEFDNSISTDNVDVSVDQGETWMDADVVVHDSNNYQYLATFSTADLDSNTSYEVIWRINNVVQEETTSFVPSPQNPPTGSDGNDSSSNLGLILGITFGIIGAIFLVGIGYWFYSKRKAK